MEGPHQGDDTSAESLEMAQQLGALASSTGPRVEFQHLHGASQQSVNLVPEILTPSSGPCDTRIHVGKTLIHIINKWKKDLHAHWLTRFTWQLPELDIS